ncbi:MAG: T9SS type A sorting domain-containing protein [Ignavibacteriae bacterium]|nr:T9SS C-terminal target domain-containing protein [Ignavibacteriota bacterium]NOG98541.1 T9SS type A sorting domain-containing protein [Ignavibacteriota bacterium]
MKKVLMFLLFVSSYTLAQYTTPGTGVDWNLDDLVTNSAGTVTGVSPNYTINELVTVSASDKISIAAGVTVNFTTANAGFEVDGSLTAIGTNLAEITFTSPTPDSTGAYEGFRFNETSVDAECIFNYVRIEYAYYGFRAVGASPTITNSTLYKCRRGVNLSNSDAVIQFNIIERSYENGINMTLGSNALVENNILASNNTRAVSARNQISVGLQGTNSPIIRGNTIYDGQGIRTGGISLWVSGSSNNSDAIIENNTIYDNSFGIALYSSNDGNLNAIVRGNTIYNNTKNPDASVSGSGINVNGSPFNQPIITRNTIHDNWWGITIQSGTSVVPGPQPNVGNIFNADTSDDGWNKIYNNIQGTDAFDLYNNCTNDIFAHNNDWGVYDSASIENNIFHKVDDPAHGSVFFVPFWNGVIPVELTSFTAAASAEGILLNWSTATEVNNLGFDVERNTNSSWEKIGFKEGAGSTTNPVNYSFVDKDNLTGKVSYRLKQIDYDGTTEFSKVVEVTIDNVVKDFNLEQNYPNPFNPTTIIKFRSQKSEFATLKVFDALGSEVTTLVNKILPAGEHSFNFDASNLPSGIYYYKINAGDYSQTRKMMLLK